MPHNDKFTIDFTPPHSLKEAVQRFSLELNCVMNWMRNEARYHEDMDFKVLEAAHHVEQLLRDSQSEAAALLPQIEYRVEWGHVADRQTPNDS